MLLNNPIVSIIIPTYNRAHLLVETLESVLAQTYSNWECIIVDDNSTDETQLLLNEYSNKDNRFTYIIKSEKQKKGASISRNLGLKIARGELIQFLDSDDLLADNKIQEQIKLLINENKYTVCTCKWGKFIEKSDPLTLIENSADYRDFNTTKEYFDLIGINGGFFPPINFLINKELINQSGYWNESLTVNDDGEFFFRVLLNANKIVFCAKTYVLYRNNLTDNLSILNSEIKAISLLNSWKIIEALYTTKYNEETSDYINKKKSSIYNEFKNNYPKIITKNKDFFKQQIKEDTLVKKISKLKKELKTG